MEEKQGEEKLRQNKENEEKIYKRKRSSKRRYMLYTIYNTWQDNAKEKNMMQ